MYIRVPVRREIFAMKKPVLSSFLFFLLFVSFSHKTLDKHNSQRKASLDLVYSKIDIAFAVLHPFVCYGLQLTTAQGSRSISYLANTTPFCSSECAHAQFTMQARVASSPGQRTASDKKLGGLGTRLLPRSV